MSVSINLDGIESVVVGRDTSAGCGFGRLLASLPDDQADRLRRLVEDRNTSAPKLAAFLTAQGVPMSQPIINGHRARTCSCDKAGLR